MKGYNVFSGGFRSVVFRVCSLWRLKGVSFELIISLFLSPFAGSRKQRFNELYYYYLVLINVGGSHIGVTRDQYRFKVGEQTLSARKPGVSNDLECLNQIFGRDEYKVFADLWRTHFGGRPGIFLDLGGNVGYASLYLQQALDVEKIICVEPDPANFSILKDNISMNGITSLDARNVGVWSENTFLEYRPDVPSTATWALSFSACDHDTGIYAIDFFQLISSNVGTSYLDIMKMDIEGTESVLFDKPDLMRQVLARTRIIGIEIHEFTADRRLIEGMLTGSGFELRHCGDMTFGANLNLVNRTLA